ncbi:hypothetical protein [Tunturiibacter lichenicola]|uniref:hypothetical protein n=1 Tax=Tunturiibacter lichenicola TaxID=2051959 RepID=UPI0021B257A3|nr:hypothetical protein [Edaphobacter lichenicola]
MALGCLLYGAMVVAAHQQRKHFAQGVQVRLDQLAKIEVGRTSRAEVLASIPELKPVPATSGYFYLCNKNPDCVMGGTTGSPRWLLWILQSNKLNWIIQKTHSGWVVVSIFRMIGFEERETSLSLTFCDGLVEYWNYEIAATSHAGRDSIMLRVIAAPPKAKIFMEGRPHDENFDFWVERIFDNWGDLAQRVVFAPAASGELKRVALHPNLTCLQSYRGCETAKQLIPDALTADRQIRETSMARLRGPVPCPERIVRSYAEHASWIATAEVASARVDPTEPLGRLIQLRSVVPIKGVPQDVGRELPMLSYSEVSEHMAPNRVASLAKPGNKVILLEGGSYFFTDGACTTVPATEENLRAVRQQN